MDNCLDGKDKWWASGTLFPHTSAIRTTIQLPVRYHPQADCPQWEAFLAAVLPPDVVAAGVIWQVLGSLPLPSTDAHQAVLLSGPGGNGKGALLVGILAGSAVARGTAAERGPRRGDYVPSRRESTAHFRSAFNVKPKTQYDLHAAMG